MRLTGRIVRRRIRACQMDAEATQRLERRVKLRAQKNSPDASLWPCQRTGLMALLGLVEIKPGTEIKRSNAGNHALPFSTRHVWDFRFPELHDIRP